MTIQEAALKVLLILYVVVNVGQGVKERKTENVRSYRSRVRLSRKGENIKRDHDTRC